MFCDELNIKVIAGRGGNGCMSFRREKYVPKGGPDGGDGGNGGDIIFKVNKNFTTLSHLAHQKRYEAPKGVHGMGKKMHGKNAPVMIIEVPLGTVIYNAEKTLILADLDTEDAEIIIAKGGKGGKGNARFVSSTYQVPRFAESGEPGEEKKINLELKLVADVGLIGLPSAGKSTLISVISNAKPKIAAYHFTTLNPNLGIVNLERFGGSKESSFVVADIPGLIEGASEGKGLGHQFLRHVTRTKLLVHIIDGSLDTIDKDYKIIKKELEKFDKELAKRPEIIVINKADLLDEESLKEKIKAIKKVSKSKDIFTISAINTVGLKDLVFAILKKLEEMKNEEKTKIIEKVQPQVPVLKPHLDEAQFTISNVIIEGDKKIFEISGKRIDQIIIMTDTKNLEGLERIYHFIEKIGIKKLVEKQGANYGDVYKVKDKIIPYRK